MTKPEIDLEENIIKKEFNKFKAETENENNE